MLQVEGLHDSNPEKALIGSGAEMRHVCLDYKNEHRCLARQSGAMPNPMLLVEKFNKLLSA